MRSQFLFLMLGLLTGCVGTDLIDEPLSPAPAKAVIDQNELTLIPDESSALSFRILAVDGSEVEGTWVWSSRAVGIADVDSDGVVTANSVGQTWIDGETDSALKDSVLVTVVSDPNAVASVVLDGDDSNLEIGDVRQLNALVSNADGDELSGISLAWTSSDPAVATVDEQGLVTAVGDGTANITATAEGVQSLPFSIQVGNSGGQRSGSFMGLNGYAVSGTAILEIQGEETRLVFNDAFSAQNGPGLNVYLSPNENNVSGGVNLGKLTSTSGAQSYTIPPSVDTDAFDYVIIYCQPFGIPFGNCVLE